MPFLLFKMGSIRSDLKKNDTGRVIDQAYFTFGGIAPSPQYEDTDSSRKSLTSVKLRGKMKFYTWVFLLYHLERKGRIRKENQLPLLVPGQELLLDP